MPGQQVAQRPPDHVQLIDVASSRPQSAAPNHFGEQATDRPNVHRSAVLRIADQQLGRPIPAGGHVVRVVLAGTCLHVW